MDGIEHSLGRVTTYSWTFLNINKLESIHNSWSQTVTFTENSGCFFWGFCNTATLFGKKKKQHGFEVVQRKCPSGRTQERGWESELLTWGWDTQEQLQKSSGNTQLHWNKWHYSDITQLSPSHSPEHMGEAHTHGAGKTREAVKFSLALTSH